MEVSLERQLLEAVLVGGPHGVLNTHIFESLKLNQKRYAPRLVEVVRKYGLQVRSETVAARNLLYESLAEV